VPQSLTRTAWNCGIQHSFGRGSTRRLFTIGMKRSNGPILRTREN
jgi:hypothetical protein